LNFDDHRLLCERRRENGYKRAVTNSDSVIASQPVIQSVNARDTTATSLTGMVPFQKPECVLNEPWWVTIMGCVTLAALFAFALIAV